MFVKKKSMHSEILLLGSLCVLAGCNFNLQGSNFSNIGNGNSVSASVGDINAGNGNNIGIPGDPTKPGDPGYVGPGKIVRTELSPATVTLRRLPPGEDLGPLNYDFGSNAFVNNIPNPYPSASPSPFRLDLGDCFLKAKAFHEGGASFEIGKDMLNNSEWKLILPPGVETRDYQIFSPYNGAPPILLVARSEAATGSFQIRLVNQRDASIPEAVANVEIVNQGSANVIVE